MPLTVRSAPISATARDLPSVTALQTPLKHSNISNNSTPPSLHQRTCFLVSSNPTSLPLPLSRTGGGAGPGANQGSKKIPVCK